MYSSQIVSILIILFLLFSSSHSKKLKKLEQDQLYDDDPSITELHKAAFHDLVELSEYYLEIDPSSLDKKTTKEGFTPLLAACSRGNKQIISLLLENGANPNSQDHQGLTCLHHLVRSDKSSFVSFFINECSFNNLNLNLDLGDYQRMTPLHYVIFEVEDLKEADAMIDAFHKGGADLSARNSQETTPLFVSILFNKYKLAKKLLKLQAEYSPSRNILSPNSYSLTPFHVIFEGPFRSDVQPLPFDRVQRYQVLELLLQRLDQQDPNTIFVPNKKEEKLEHYLDISKLEKSLLNHLVKIGEYLYSPLHLVVYELDYPAIGLLLKSGALLSDPRSLTTETIWHTLEIKDEEEELVDDQLIRFFLLHTSEWSKSDVQFWITTILRNKHFSPKKSAEETEEEAKERQEWEKVKKRIFEHFSEVKGRTLLPITDNGLETIVNHNSERAKQLFTQLQTHLKEFKIGTRTRIGFEIFWNIWDSKYPIPSTKRKSKNQFEQKDLF